ncbi:MAG: hypothetical protein Q6353_006610 [Candidatus Sigynarchaeum springense]
MEKSPRTFHERSRKGENVDEFDCMIVGTVMSQKDGALLTNNAAHFNRIDGLRLVSFPEGNV